MSALREAAQQALEALEYAQQDRECPSTTHQAITALSTALAQEQAEPLNLSDRAVQRRLAAQWGHVPAERAEPVAWVECDGELVWKNREAAIGRNLYTTPPRRTMVPLTEEEIDAEWHELDGEASPLFKRVIRKFARAIEKASWEKNNGKA